jgi:hypothetical protein
LPKSGGIDGIECTPIGGFLQTDPHAGPHASLVPGPSLTPRRNSSKATGPLPARCT